MRGRSLVLLAAAAALGLVACGEKKQTVVYKQGKYQGKPDNRSWDNESPVAELRGGKWTKGDRMSWEESVKQRQLTQNEYRRIGQ
jgi:hypothetical protein